jgi:predicted DNA-binding protein YlxM (UPF0122 family)
MTKNKAKLTKRQIEAMKEMFMKYTSISEIARTFKVARNTVSYHVNSNAWEAQRKLSESEMLSSFGDAKKVDFVKMTQSSVVIMQRALENLATRHEAPSINEATRAADILKTLDNILRLDEGKPTDIVEQSEKPMSKEELKKKIAVDPFSGILEEETDDKKIN